MITPLSLASPLSSPERITELERLVADLKRTQLEQGNRIAVLEGALRRGVAAPLARHNASRRDNARALRQAIARVLVEEPRPGDFTRKQVLHALEREGSTGNTRPTLSTIGWHIREIRRAQAVNVNARVLTPQL